MIIHQMQRHLELPQSRASTGGASLLILECDEVRFLPLDAFAHFDDNEIDLCKMPVSIACPNETLISAAEATAQMANEPLIVSLRHIRFRALLAEPSMA